MNPNTGEIKPFPTRADAVAAGFTVPLTNRQAAGLGSVANAERLAGLEQKRNGRPVFKPRKFKARAPRSR